MKRKAGRATIRVRAETAADKDNVTQAVLSGSLIGALNAVEGVSGVSVSEEKASKRKTSGPEIT